MHDVFVQNLKLKQYVRLFDAILRGFQARVLHGGECAFTVQRVRPILETK